jgi:5'-phosphate synthase pdxT subunit
LIKLPEDLVGIDALILPGGESTTMSILMDKHQLRQPLNEFARSHPVYGTCAGMIMLAARIADNQSGVKSLGIMDIDVLRNGYGRQVFSSEERLQAELPGYSGEVQATFIRAPRVIRYGAAVTPLVWFQKDPVLLWQGNLLASSFHNELGNDTTVLRFFLGHFLGDKQLS